VCDDNVITAGWRLAFPVVFGEPLGGPLVACGDAVLTVGNDAADVGLLRSGCIVWCWCRDWLFREWVRFSCQGGECDGDFLDAGFDVGVCRVAGVVVVAGVGAGDSVAEVAFDPGARVPLSSAFGGGPCPVRAPGGGVSPAAGLDAGEVG
jgi:hypothetical protein